MQKKAPALFKSITLCVFALFFINFGYGQAPQAMNYQAVVRNTSGQPITSGNVSVRFTIHDGSATGTNVFQEVQTASPNQFGLINLQMGTGGGSLSSVSWGSGSKYLQVEIDVAGGSNYVDMGTSQLISVPYALFAANSNAGPQGPTGSQGLQGPTGATGPTGPNGAVGATGADGLNGLNGATGATGPQGLAGNNGATGAQGNNGLDGVTGAQGPQGVTGPQGPAGETGAGGAQGATGAPGPQGLAGTNGIDGVTGAQGTQGPAGAQGATGATGVQGPVGSAGINGVTGAQGPTGNTGATGVQGIQGLHGITGATGNNGTNGVQGPQGVAGVNGNDGATGAQGPQGPTGNNGNNGAQGPAGPTGATGNNGNDGAQGPQGPTGNNGNNGAQGPAGPTGATGNNGNDGAQGPQGPTGNNGNDGAQGPAGPTGVTGNNGNDGAQGPQGPTGNNGNNGAQGPAGPTGATGNNGNDGAQGPQGPAGAQGPQGNQGPAGNNGNDGAQGPQGPAGAQGPQGNQGPAGNNGNDGAQGPQGPAGPVGCGSPNYLVKSNGSSAVCSVVYDDGTNVGIGISTPGYKLDVNGNALVRSGLTVSGTAFSISGGSGNIYANGDNHTGGGVSISDDGGFFDYNDAYVTYNGTTGFKIAGNAGAGSDGLLYVQGRAGIGTASPPAPFSVIYGTAASSSSGGSSNWYDPTNFAGYIQNNSNAPNRYGLLVSDFWRSSENYPFAVDGRYYIDGSLANDLHNPYLVVRGDGNVGIGTATPAYKLEVNGDLNVNGAIKGRVWTANLGSNVSYTNGSGLVTLLSVSVTSRGGDLFAIGKIHNIINSGGLRVNLFLDRLNVSTGVTTTLDTWTFWQTAGSTYDESGVVIYTDTPGAGSYVYYLRTTGEAGTRTAQTNGTRMTVTEF